MESHQPSHRESDNLHGSLTVTDGKAHSQADRSTHGSTDGLPGPDRDAVAQPVRRTVAYAVTWPHRVPYDHPVSDGSSVSIPLHPSFGLTVHPAVACADGVFAAIARAVDPTFGVAQFKSLLSAHLVTNLCRHADNILPSDAPL
jgi:hypothetical protein